MAERTPKSIEMLQGLEGPSFLASRSSVTEYLTHSPEERAEIAELEREKIELIVKVLNHPELDRLIKEDKITLGMIKPHVEKGRNIAPDQDEAAAQIAQEIGEEHIIFNQPFFLTEPDLDQFYGHVKENLTSTDRAEIWDGFVDFMSTGPVNVFLLYFPEGDAVAQWRTLMGPTNPERAIAEFPETIRGRHATVLPDNTVHGSDSPASVIREKRIISNALISLI